MTGAPAIPISVSLGEACTRLGEHRAQLAAGIAADVAELLAAVGLPGEPVVEVVDDMAMNRPARICVHGRVLRFPPYLLWSAFLRQDPTEAMAGPDSREGMGFPADWLADAEAGGASTDAALRALVVECIRARPGALVCGDHGVGLLDDAGPSSLPPAKVLASVLAHALDMGMALDPEIVAETLRAGFAAGRTPADVAEGLARRLRADVVELHVHPRFAPELLGGAELPDPRSATDPELAEDVTAAFYVVREAIESGPGVPSPDPVWVPSELVPPGYVSVKVNDVLAPPVAVPDRSHVVTGERPQQLASRGFLVDRSSPALERTVSWLPATAAESLEQAGLQFWTGPQLAALLVSSAVVLRPGRVFTVAEAEHQLAQLAKYYPELVEDALAQFSFPDLTRILRGIIEGGAPISNLREILQRLVLFEDRPVDVPGAWAILDDLVPALEDEPAWERMIAHARLVLGEDILAERVPPGWPVVIVPIDDSLSDAAVDDPAEAERCDAVLDRVWTLVRDARLRRAHPVVVTDTTSRPALQALVAGELPAVPVLAWPELPLGRSIIDASEEDGPVTAFEQITRSRVHDMLARLYDTVAIDQDGDFVVMDDDLRIYVVPRQTGEISLIEVFSYALRDVSPSPDLFRWVALGGCALPFGRVQLLESGDVVHVLISYELLGNYLDADELAMAVFAVANNARSTVSEIAGRFGVGGSEGGEPSHGPAASG